MVSRVGCVCGIEYHLRRVCCFCSLDKRQLVGMEGLDMWRKIVMLTVLPFTAGFCEELIWRGYIFTQLEARGYGLAKAIVFSAISFALIHGITLPDKLLTTFLFGIVAGLYYARERNLIPLMIAHIVMDVWSFGLSCSPEEEKCLPK